MANRRLALARKVRSTITGGRWTRFGRWYGGAGDRWLRIRLDSLAPDYYSAEVARELPPIANAVRLLGNELASLPIVVEQRRDGEWKPVSEFDPEYALVAAAWEPNRNAVQALRMLMDSVLLWGFAAVYVVRTEAGGVERIVLLDPERVTRAGQDGEVTYRYSGPAIAGVPARLDMGNLAFVEQAPDHDRSRQPMSAFERSWPSVRAGIALARFNATFFDRGAVPQLFMVVEDPKFAAQQKSLQQEMNTSMDKQRAEGRTAFVVPRGLKPMSVGATPREAQVDTRVREATLSVAQLTGIPPTLLMDYNRATYVNAPTELRHFVRLTLSSWAWIVQHALSRALWPTGSRRMRFDTSDPGDESRYDTTRRLQMLVFSGVMTANEARALLDMDPSDDEQADRLYRTPTLPVMVDGMQQNGQLPAMEGAT